MILAVIGSRTFDYYPDMKSMLDAIHCKHGIDKIVSGGAKGADNLAERWADENGVEKLIILAEWDKYGPSAGYKRNALVEQAADAVVAFWDGKSKGTKHCVDLFAKNNKKVAIWRF